MKKKLLAVNLIIFVLLVLLARGKELPREEIVKTPLKQSSLPKPSLLPKQEIASPSPNPKPSPSAKITQQLVQATGPWGVAQQIDDVTWTMKIGFDDRMAAPKEIFEALNIYRNSNGSHAMQWDDKLAAYAQSRADYFASIKNTDGHKGLNVFLSNPDNFGVLGATNIGENSSYGYRLLGVHIIEWLYASDEPHNKNQLDPKWNRVGIGVKDTATDLIFGS